MLKEIESDSFVCNGEPRGVISFEMGLNTVLGGNTISNSIGKTTFLKVIDFVFGGDTYNSMASITGSHKIKFMHTFDKDYRFIRCPDSPDVVSVCKDNCYDVAKDITVEEFRRFLLDKYNIADIGLPFDEITKPYIRLTQRKCNTDNILSNGNSANKTEEITTLERLFKKFDQISNAYDEIQKVQEQKKEYVNNQHANMQLCISITSEQHKTNEAEISSLKNKLKEFTKDKNYEMTQQHLEEGKAVAEINEQISLLSNDRKHYLANVAKIESSFSDSELYENDFAELRRYFNNTECNFQALKDVQVFHNTIGRILSKELEEEKERLKSLIQAVDERIVLLENKKAEINLPSMIPVEDFIKYSRIQERISLLENQNKNADVLNEYQARLTVERKKYNQVQVDILTSIQNQINTEISSIYTTIIGENCTSPTFEVNENLIYQYGIESDLGDGDSNKSLIAFDLSILHLTVLPYIIHDSRLFSGVDRHHVSNIIRQYADVMNKQIFISIDDIDNYPDDVKEIITKSCRIELGSGSKALYGRRFS